MADGSYPGSVWMSLQPWQRKISTGRQVRIAGNFPSRAIGAWQRRHRRVPHSAGGGVWTVSDMVHQGLQNEPEW